MEPRPESLWWTSTYKAEDKVTLKVKNGGLTWDLPFKEVFGVLGCRFHRDGKGAQGSERTLCKGVGSWWRNGHITWRRNVKEWSFFSTPSTGGPGASLC